MFQRALTILMVAGLFHFVADVVEAGSQTPALNRVAKQVGQTLKANRRNTVRFVPAKDANDVGKRIETAFVAALKANDLVEDVEDDAKFSVRIDYIRSGQRVSLEVIMFDSRGQSLGKYSANFELDEE